MEPGGHGTCGKPFSWWCLLGSSGSLSAPALLRRLTPCPASHDNSHSGPGLELCQHTGNLSLWCWGQRPQACPGQTGASAGASLPKCLHPHRCRLTSSSQLSPFLTLGSQASTKHVSTVSSPVCLSKAALLKLEMRGWAPTPSPKAGGCAGHQQVRNLP